jgi:signal recognition particle subunit SRP54
MFDSLSEKLGGILDRLTRRGALSEADVDAALREVRRALLDADVALDVARSFIDNVKKQAVGATVVKSVTPGQMVVKIVHDQLVAMLGTDSQSIDLNAAPPVAIMMVGLQGSGKTTTTAKIARRLTDRQKKKVLMASLDVRRPAAPCSAARRRSIRFPLSPASCRRRSRSARSKPRCSAATMSCCSIPPAALRSTTR